MNDCMNGHMSERTSSKWNENVHSNDLRAREREKAARQQNRDGDLSQIE